MGQRYRVHGYESVGARLMFLLPDNPDFNPIEQTLSKLKAHLREAAERAVQDLWNAIGRILDRYSPQERANDFAARGYDADRKPFYIAAWVRKETRRQRKWAQTRRQLARHILRPFGVAGQGLHPASSISRTRRTSVSTANGLVSTCMPRSRCPWFNTAFSA